jgi:hypothetical protein
MENAMFTIEQDVPLASGAKNGLRAAARYPFGVMRVGDSFVIPAADAAKALEAAKKWRQRHAGWQHAWARDETGDLRIWRTA